MMCDVKIWRGKTKILQMVATLIGEEKNHIRYIHVCH